MFGRPRDAYLGGGETVERAVWPIGVVLDAPHLDYHFGFEQRTEVLEVEQFVAHAAVEALDLGVLPRRARFDETDPDCDDAGRQSGSAHAMTSGLLSQRNEAGGP